VIARRLDAAGLGTVESIAKASHDELIAVPGLGHHAAQSIKTQALSLTGGSASSEVAAVASSVKSLRAAIPGLAKSDKHAKRLKKSTRRMTDWVDDLGRRRVREQFVAEVGRIRGDAKKRTPSKKKARALRQHAKTIEKALETIG
jgi:hypothetical protein